MALWSFFLKKLWRLLMRVRNALLPQFFVQSSSSINNLAVVTTVRAAEIGSSSSTDNVSIDVSAIDIDSSSSTGSLEVVLDVLSLDICPPHSSTISSTASADGKENDCDFDVVPLGAAGITLTSVDTAGSFGSDIVTQQFIGIDAPPTDALLSSDEAAAVAVPVANVAEPVFAQWVLRAPPATIPSSSFCIVLIGGHPSLGEWTAARAVEMYPEDDLFLANVHLDAEFSRPIEYKYAIVSTVDDHNLGPEAWESCSKNNRKLKIVAWEMGENRVFEPTEDGGGITHDEMRVVHWV